MFNNLKKHAEEKKLAKNLAIISMNNITNYNNNNDKKIVPLFVPSYMMDSYRYGKRIRQDDIIRSLIATTALGQNSTVQFRDNNCIFGEKDRAHNQTIILHQQDLSDVYTPEITTNINDSNFIKNLCRTNNIEIIEYDKDNEAVVKKIQDYMKTHYSFETYELPNANPKSDKFAVFIRTLARFFVRINTEPESPYYLSVEERSNTGKRYKELAEDIQRISIFLKEHPEVDQTIGNAIITLINSVWNEWRYQEDFYSKKIQ